MKNRNQRASCSVNSCKPNKIRKYKKPKRISTSKTIKIYNFNCWPKNQILNVYNKETVSTHNRSKSIDTNSLDCIILKSDLKEEEFRSTKEEIKHKAKINTLNIIVADDEEITRQSAIRMIKNSAKELNVEINIIEAKDGIEVLYIMYTIINDGNKITAILSDETMDFLRGSECSKIINSIQVNKGFDSIPFFILTAYEDSNTINELKSCNILEVFTKPLSKFSCKKFINNILSNK